MILESLDDGQNLEINITVDRNGEMINMNIEEPLQSKSLWKASISAYGCETDTVVDDIELSEYCYDGQSSLLISCVVYLITCRYP